MLVPGAIEQENLKYLVTHNLKLGIRCFHNCHVYQHPGHGLELKLTAMYMSFPFHTCSNAYAFFAFSSDSSWTILKSFELKNIPIAVRPSASTASTGIPALINILAASSARGSLR